MSAGREPPRVLLMTETYWPEIGGGERQARLLARQLARLGHAVTVTARRSRARLPWRDDDEGVRVVRLPPTGPGRWRKWLLVLPALWLLIVSRGAYDVVLVSGFRLLGVAALGARALTGRPTLLKADSSGEYSGEYFRAGLARVGLTPRSWPVRVALGARNALLRRADGYVALSEEMARELVRGGVEAARIHAIGNGVDTELFRPASEEERLALRGTLELPTSGLVVVYTGRLVSYKGLPLLLEAWRDVHRRFPAAVLVFVGEGGNDMHACEQELRARAAAADLNAGVRFTGAVDNVHEWLRAADAFAFPTENEAFGLALVEAMACGLACMTTTVGGLRDFVAHEVNALAVPARDRDAVKAALERLLSDEALRHRLGSAARGTALERFGSEAVAAAYAALFRGIVSGGAR